MAEITRDGKTESEVTIVNTGSGGPRAHRTGCRDVARLTRGNPGSVVDHYPAGTKWWDIARDWYGDIATDTTVEGTPEWETEVWDLFEMDVDVLPCL